MKHLKIYENFDFNEDDFDFEEENDDYEGDYYLTRSTSAERVTLERIYIKRKSKEKYSNETYSYYSFFDDKIIWGFISDDDVEHDLRHENYNIIRLFNLDEWGSDRMKMVWMDLTGKELPIEYNGRIIEYKKK